MKSWVRVLTALPALTACALFSACASSRSPEVSFPDPARREDLVRIRVARDLTGSVELVKAEGKWTVAPDGVPVDSARLRDALDLLFRLHARETVARVTAGDEAALEPFGMDPGNALSIELGFGPRPAKVAHLLLGQAAEDYQATYWMVEGGEGVHRVSGNTAFAISSESDAWKSRRLFPDFTGEREIRELRVTWGDSAGGGQGFYRAVRVGADSLLVVDPDSGGIPRRKALDLLGRAGQLIVDAFPDSAEAARALSRSDSAAPVLVEAILQNGESHRLKAWQDEGEYWYALHPAGDAVVKLLRWRLRDLMIPVPELVLPYRLGPEPYDGMDYSPPPPGFGVWAPHFRDEPEGADGHGHEDHEDHGEE